MIYFTINQNNLYVSSFLISQKITWNKLNCESGFTKPEIKTIVMLHGKFQIVSSEL